MPEAIVYQSPGSYLQVIETPNKFYYAQRKNKDSVAVFLLRKSSNASWEVLIRMQPLPIMNTELGEQMPVFPCPITGSLDYPDESPVDCAKREVLEEAGYDLKDVKSLGSYIVGTQTNEIVYMFWQDVSTLNATNSLGDDSIFEKQSFNKWSPLACLSADGQYAANQIAYLRIVKALGLEVF